MTNRSATKSARMQPDMFGKAQPDLFGDEPVQQNAYVPKPEHVRSSLRSLVCEMEEAETWPWPASLVAARRNHWLEHLCSLLPDQSEADEWRRRIAGQTARLDAAQEAIGR